MGDAFQKRNAWRWAAPKLRQRSTWWGFGGMLLGAVAVGLGADPSVVDIVGELAANVAVAAGGPMVGAGAVAALRDDGSDA